MNPQVRHRATGIEALQAAHKHVLMEGGELRLVVPADGAVHRVLTLLGIDHFIHCFASLEEAVALSVRRTDRSSRDLAGCQPCPADL
jgi:STAS domain